MIKYMLPLLALAAGSPGLAQDLRSVPVVATAVSEAAPDAAKLEISRRVAARLVPDGVFMKVMSATMDQITGGMMDQMMDLPLRELATKFAKDPADVKSLGPGTVREIMQIMDPAFKERTDVSMKTMFRSMGGVMTSMEPEMREGMAIAYANRFSSDELADLDRFFSSPSGARFAEQNLTIMTDPALAKRMQALLPRVLDAMPAIIKDVEAATASLPKPRSADDLSKDERSRLAQLLGVREKDLK